MVVCVYYLQRRLIVPLPPEARLDDADDGEEPADTSWSPRQEEAWGDVGRLPRSVDPDRITSRDAALNLALETIETVARRLHPESKDPLLQFTVPEALAVIERASANLRGFLVSSFPLGDRITVAQLMWLYRWRGAMSWSRRATTFGASCGCSTRSRPPRRSCASASRARSTRPAASTWRAGWRAPSSRRSAARPSTSTAAACALRRPSCQARDVDLGQDLAAAETREAEPVRILVAGQTGAGKSSLVNALANAVEAAVDVVPATASFAAYRLIHEGLPAALLIDSPGLTGAGA